MIYLDWAATSPPLPRVLQEMSSCSTSFYGNPSSLHSEGRKAGEKLEEFRQRCAAVLGCRSEKLTFCSGGSEANNMITSSLYHRKDKGRIVISGIEHPSLWNPLQALSRHDWEVKIINPDKNGLICPGRLEKALTPDTKMVLIMGVHNETGVIQPVKDLQSCIRKHESPRPIHFHSDLIQWAGKLPLDMGDLDLDSASLAAHKFQGPRGVGILYQKKPQGGLHCGGGQEGGLRPGTENLPAIAGMTVALEEAARHLRENDQKARVGMALLAQGISGIPGARILPESRRYHEEHFSPWILNCAIPPLPGEVLVRVMDENGFAISSGSACSRNKKSRTRALEAMGVDVKTAFSSIRISLGPDTDEKDIVSFTRALATQCQILARALP